MISEHLPTLTKQLGVCCFLEDDYSRTQGGEGNIQTATTGKGPELWGKVLQVSP